MTMDDARRARWDAAMDALAVWATPGGGTWDWDAVDGPDRPVGDSDAWVLVVTGTPNGGAWTVSAVVVTAWDATAGRWDVASITTAADGCGGGATGIKRPMGGWVR